MGTVSAEIRDGVQRLCCHILGVESTSHALGPHYQGVISAISSPVYACKCNVDEVQLVEKIRRHLSKSKGENEANRFTSLYRRLSNKKSLRHHGEQLEFLRQLGVSKGTQPQSSSSATGLSLQNGGRVARAMTSVSEQNGINGTGKKSRLPSSRSTEGFIVKKSSSVSSTHHRTTPSVSPTKTVPRPVLNGRNSYDPTAVKVSEQAIIRDVMYVLQGIDGQLVRRSGNKDQSFMLDPSARIGRSHKEAILKLAECGWLYSRVKDFCESKSTSNGSLMRQAFAAALHEELVEYYRLLSLVQAQVNQSDDQALTPGVDSSSVSLRKILLWTFQPKQRLKHLALLADSCQDKRGGALISAIRSHFVYGNPETVKVVRRLLEASCRPLHNFIVRWIYDGQLEDQFDEFFVAANSSVGLEELWSRKYQLRESMIPSFVNIDQANKILLAGKSINFLRAVCHEHVHIVTLAEKKKAALAADVSYLFDHFAEDSIDDLVSVAYDEICQHLLKLMIDRFLLWKHLEALKKYLLLSQGDFARYLMDLLYEELQQPATELYVHNLTGVLDTALRQTNAALEPQEILDRIDVKPVGSPASSEKGWDIFQLQYHVKEPLNTVLPQETMNQYSRMFSFIWRIKRLDYVLSMIWDTHMAEVRGSVAVVPEVKPLFHSACLFGREMLHFIRELQYYLTYEVLECSWAKLKNSLSEAKDLDGILVAHQSYVNGLMNQTFLSGQCGDLHDQLMTIFDLVFEFEAVVNNLYQAVSEEAERRRNIEHSIVVECDLDLDELAEREHFAQTTMSDVRPKLAMVTDHYRDKVQQFLVQLTNHPDDHLRLLSFRIDYSQFYQSRDKELDCSLMYRRASRRYHQRQVNA